MFNLTISTKNFGKYEEFTKFRQGISQILTNFQTKYQNLAKTLESDKKNFFFYSVTLSETKNCKSMCLFQKKFFFFIIIIVHKK